MKKNRFYNNKKRNQKWTEEVRGRQIDFADKYVENGIYSDKYDYLREKPKKKKKRFSPETALKAARGFGAVIISILLIFTGYTVMDVYMIRHQMPALSGAQGDSVQNMKEAVVETKGKYTDAVSLDGGEMLMSVIQQLQDSGYSAAVFDIKRQDGTVAYRSTLSNIDAYGAVSFAADNLALSVSTLGQYDILAVGRVYCYADSLAPQKNTDMAVLNKDGTLYTDSAGNTYLNPNSDEAYGYIKDIIAECYEMGVTVFVLDGFDIPSDISGGESGGFEALAERLYGDIGTGIKLLQAENIKIDSDEDTKAEDVEEKISSLGSISADDRIYFITSEYADLKELLDENEITSYIIS